MAYLLSFICISSVWRRIKLYNISKLYFPAQLQENIIKWCFSPLDLTKYIYFLVFLFLFGMYKYHDKICPYKKLTYFFKMINYMITGHNLWYFRLLPLCHDPAMFPQPSLPPIHLASHCEWKPAGLVIYSLSHSLTHLLPQPP